MESLRVGLLGLNAWVVILVVPSLHHAGFEPRALGGLLPVTLALLPLALLALGLSWLRAETPRARWALLALFPPSLGVAVAIRPSLVEREVFDPVTIGLGALSLAAYAVAAARACARPEETMPTTIRHARSREPVAEPRTRTLVRRAVLGLTTLGGLGLVAVVPIWTGRAERAERWGEGADDGTVLTIVVGTLAASFAIGAIVGPGLRARRRATRAKGRGRRIAVALGVAAIAGVGWFLLRQLDAA